MTYSFLKHTADMKMKVEDGTFPGLFAEALLGMFAYLKPLRQEEKKVKRTFELSAPNSATLLVNFLNEILTLAQSHKEAYDSIYFDKLVGQQIKCQIYGCKVKKFGEGIKVATYREAKIEHLPRLGWRAHVIFEI